MSSDEHPTIPPSWLAHTGKQWVWEGDGWGVGRDEDGTHLSLDRATVADPEHLAAVLMSAHRVGAPQAEDSGA